MNILKVQQYRIDKLYAEVVIQIANINKNFGKYGKGVINDVKRKNS